MAGAGAGARTDGVGAGGGIGGAGDGAGGVSGAGAGAGGGTSGAGAGTAGAFAGDGVGVTFAGAGAGGFWGGGVAGAGGKAGGGVAGANTGGCVGETVCGGGAIGLATGATFGDGGDIGVFAGMGDTAGDVTGGGVVVVGGGETVVVGGGTVGNVEGDAAGVWPLTMARQPKMKTQRTEAILLLNVVMIELSTVQWYWVLLEASLKFLSRSLAKVSKTPSPRQNIIGSAVKGCAWIVLTMMRRDCFERRVLVALMIQRYSNLLSFWKEGTRDAKLEKQVSMTSEDEFLNSSSGKSDAHLRLQSPISTTATGNGNISGDRIYAPFSVYKGKAALSIEPVLPTFTKMDSGSLRVGRSGSMMMSFMPSIGERKYDYEKKQLFALSPTEVGSLISLGPKDSSEFFHDPSMKSSNAGQVRKSLSIKPHADGSGYFISLSVVNNVLRTNERVTVPITTAEFAVLKTACSFALPHIMGWDRLTSAQQLKDAGNPLKPKLQPELEWDK
ncbi:Single-stranded DNA-binding protein WHY2, mitochondrial [Linum perenne]